MKPEKTAKDACESVIGFSDYLELGTHENVTLTLEKQLDLKLIPGKILITISS